jgi:phosphoribosylanthranilate isomerase
MIVKICGITNPDDAKAAVTFGASALGFNFWPHSPRAIAPEEAARIVRTVPAVTWKIGVFVNETSERIGRIAAEAGLDIAQLHGHCEPPGSLRVWRACSVTESFSASQLEDDSVEAYLLDAPAGERYGGSGETFDWALVRNLQRRIVLAGGLDANNVAAAIAVAKPWAVDACSRLESSPGRKDHARMAAFIRAALGSCS